MCCMVGYTHFGNGDVWLCILVYVQSNQLFVLFIMIVCMYNIILYCIMNYLINTRAS